MEKVKLSILKNFAEENKLPINNKMKHSDLRELILENIDEDLINKLVDENSSEKDTKWKNIVNWLKEKNGDDLNGVILTCDSLKVIAKKFGGKYEARLLCKYDSSNKIPNILKELKLNIVSITNSTYLLTTGSIYLSLPKSNFEIEPKSNLVHEINKNKKSVLLSLGNSEKSLIDNIFYSKPNPFQMYVDNEELIFQNLLSGRHRTHEIKAFINNIPLTIKGSQYETDACYESDNFIIVIEAKMDKSDDFNIRQIYYPYCSVLHHIHEQNVVKKVIPLYIDYDKKENIITIHELSFANLSHIDSCYIKSTKYFRFE